MSTTSSISPVPSLHPAQDPNLITAARRALEASILNTGSQLDADLQSRAATLHANNAALEKQQKALSAAVKSFAKDNDKLKKVADDAARKVKELGNVQNWAEVCHREFLVLEETIRLADASSSDESDGYERYEICEKCDRDLADVEEDQVLWCKGCDGLWHLACAGVDVKSADEWICKDCVKKGKGKAKEKEKMKLPEEQGKGKEKEVVDEVMGEATLQGGEDMAMGGMETAATENGSNETNESFGSEMHSGTLSTSTATEESSTRTPSTSISGES